MESSVGEILIFTAATAYQADAVEIAIQVISMTTAHANVMCLHIQKSSYGRGAGISLEYASNREYDSGFCYFKLNAGFYGVDLLCWSNCQGDFVTECGAFCVSSSSYSNKIQAFIKEGLNGVNIICT